MGVISAGAWLPGGKRPAHTEVRLTEAHRGSGGCVVLWGQDQHNQRCSLWVRPVYLWRGVVFKLVIVQGESVALLGSKQDRENQMQGWPEDGIPRRQGLGEAAPG